MPFISNSTAVPRQQKPTAQDNRGALRLIAQRSNATDLYFSTKSQAARIEEHSLRAGMMSAHVYLDASVQTHPYLFIGFPARNSGVSLWFKSPSGQAQIEAISPPQAVESGDLQGVQIAVHTGSKELIIDDAILGSMRFIRDREMQAVLPKIKVPDLVRGNEVVLRNGQLQLDRIGLNGISRYLMEINPEPGTTLLKENDHYKLRSASEVKFTLLGMTNEKTKTPSPLSDFFTDETLSKMDAKLLTAFSFLLYEEGLMAGSPRYFSKFGRDSVYTLHVLMDHLKPKALEKLLTATISSMNPETGDVSHEQHEGDFVAYEKTKLGESVKGLNQTLEDYKMIDPNFAFTILLGAYLKKFPERAVEFLNAREARGIVQRELIRKLFANVDKQTTPFAEKPIFSNLIRLKGQNTTGQWRDTENGLGNGKYPFDVNAAFVPGALNALVEISADPKSEFYDVKHSENLKRKFDVWNNKVIPLFEVTIKAGELEKFARAYYKTLGKDPATLPPTPTEDLIFPAIALAEDGSRIPILHSDDSMMLTFGYPTETYLHQIRQRLTLPFPYGLTTKIGILVANPIFAPALQEVFGPKNYHGTLVWTMQEDLLIYGMARQILSPETSRAMKLELYKTLQFVEHGIIEQRPSVGGIEVFAVDDRDPNHPVAVPFAGDAKGNSNQLWSHLHIIFPQLLKQVDEAMSAK